MHLINITKNQQSKVQSPHRVHAYAYAWRVRIHIIIDICMLAIARGATKACVLRTPPVHMWPWVAAFGVARLACRVHVS